MAEIKKGACGRCPRTDVSITATGGLRVHAANGRRVNEENPACPGSGEEPAAPQTAAGGGLRFLCRVPSGPEGCGAPVQLTANRRARTHLTPQGTPCPEGSSAFAIAVDVDGFKADTADWSEDRWTIALGPAEPPADLPHDRTEPLDRYAPPAGPETDAEKMHRLTEAAVEILGRRTPEDPCTCTTGPGDLEGPAEDCPAHGATEQRRRIHDSVPLLNRGEDDRTDPDTLLVRPDADPEPVWYRPDSRTTAYSDGSVWAGGETPSGNTHILDDGNGGVWRHPGPVADCRLIECGNDWHTPPDILALMPEGVRRLAEDNPECWTCGHEITPLAKQFRGDGSVEQVVWACSRAGYCDCAAKPGGCRPQHSTEEHVGRLDVDDCFVRPVAKSLRDLVYRVSTVGRDSVDAVVVSAGPYAGRTGRLTNLLEVITCTDKNGTPRPRRDRATGTTSHPGLTPGARPTPSAPAAPTPGRTPDRSSTPVTTPTVPSAGAASKRATSSGASATTSTSTPTATTTGAPVPDVFTTAKAATKESDRYDNYGRYKLLHPDSGKAVKWTRATTYAKSIADTYNLSMWSQRMTLKGAALRPDIVAAVSTLDVKEDRDRINGLVEDAKKAAGNKVAANLGTALHAFTEDRDKVLVGQPVKPQTVPESLLPSVDAYEALLASFGLMPVPGLIEFTTAVKQYEIAGTSDRCYRVTRNITFKLHGRTVTLYAGEYVIGDVKSGADLSYGWMEICVQLAIYAQGFNTSGVWDWGTGSWGRPTEPGAPDVQVKVRTDVGLIPHLPVDRKPGDPLATLFAVDLDWGWATAVLCGQVRTARKEGNLATPLTVADVEETDPDTGATVDVLTHSVPAARPATLEDKARAVTTREGASAVWQEGVAARTPKAELERLVGIMTAKLKSHVEQGA